MLYGCHVIMMVYSIPPPLICQDVDPAVSSA